MEINGIPIGEIIDEIKKEGEKDDGFSYENLDGYLNNFKNINMENKEFNGEEIKSYIDKNNLSKEDVEKARLGALLEEKDLYCEGNKILEGLVDVISKEINENNIAVNKILEVIDSVDYKNNNIDSEVNNFSNIEKLIKDLNLPINQVEVINKFLNKESLGDLQINIFGNELFNKNTFISNYEDDFIKKLEEELNKYISIKNVGVQLGKKVPDIEFTLIT